MNFILPYDDYSRNNSRVVVRGLASNSTGLETEKNKFNKRILLFLLLFCGYLKKNSHLSQIEKSTKMKPNYSFAQSPEKECECSDKTQNRVAYGTRMIRLKNFLEG